MWLNIIFIKKKSQDMNVSGTYFAVFCLLNITKQSALEQFR